MAAAPPGYNYATGAGIYSLPAAIVFSVLYAALGVWFLIRFRWEYVLIILFCTIRFVAFVLRAILANVPSAGQDQNIFLAYQIIYNVGFFSVILFLFELVCQRLKGARGVQELLKRLPTVFRIALVAAVTLGITGTCEVFFGTESSTIDTGNTLREAAIYIFVACACIVFFLSFWLASSPASGDKLRSLLVVVMSVLLVVREAFFAATVDNSTVQNNEHFWYPFAALTEILVICLFALDDALTKREHPASESKV